MKHTLFSRTTIVLITLVTPVVTLADVSGTATLNTIRGNPALNLDTGATVAAGTGDISWDGSTLTLVGKAKAYIFPGPLGQIGYSTQNEQTLNAFKFFASSAPIPSSKLAENIVLAVYTNGGHSAKVLVTGNSSGALILMFQTYIAAQSTVPTITKVQNNSSLIPDGFPNSGIAPSSIFVIVGSNLADPADLVLQSSAPPGLPTKLNGATINIVTHQGTIHPPIYYTSPTQIAAVLPASVSPQAVAISVTHGSQTSVAFATNVVSSAVGINPYNGSGVATDSLTGSLITYTNSATPGEYLTLWATGLGADPQDSDSVYTSTPHSVSTPLHIYFGAAEAAISYQGSAGYPGVSVINIQVPNGTPMGCYVSVSAVVGSLLNHTVTLPVNAGGGACLDPVTGFHGDQISPEGGVTLKTGLAVLLRTSTPNKDGSRTITNSTDAAFEKYSGLLPDNARYISPGSCVTGTSASPIPELTGLDPGSISLTGPNGLDVTLASQFGIKGAFYSPLALDAIPDSGGTFTFKGTGGADVGSFSVTLNLSPLLVWTNTSAAVAVDKTKGLDVTWTGGNPGTYVYISGAGGTANTVIGTYECLASVDAGHFHVPDYILSVIPTTNVGSTLVQNIFFVPLTASGIDTGVAGTSIGYTMSTSYNAGNQGSR